MKVKMHSGCIWQELVAIQKEEPRVHLCRCRKLIEYSEANDLVKKGAAKWVVTKRTRGEAEVSCTFCTAMTDVEKKTCAKCHGTGRYMEPKVWEDYNNDIVLMSSTPIDERNKKYRLNTRAKTPRVATIEKKHIFRAIVDNLKYAAQRIEEYGLMILEARAFCGPKNRVSMIGVEPFDDPYTQQGRKYDMGVPAVSTIGVEQEAAEQEVDLVPDPPVSSYTPKNAAGTGSLDERYKDLLAYSRKKIEEGDYQLCGKDTIIAAGISWPAENRNFYNADWTRKG